jgi:hypothetical protein
LRRLKRVTIKVVVAAILLVVGVTVAGCHSAFLRYDLIGTGHLPRSALFPIMLFAAINPIWRFLFKKPLFTSSELLFIYCALVIMSGIPGQQFSNYLYTGLVSPVYHAHPRNMPERSSSLSDLNRARISLEGIVGNLFAHCRGGTCGHLSRSHPHPFRLGRVEVCAYAFSFHDDPVLNDKPPDFDSVATAAFFHHFANSNRQRLVLDLFFPRFVNSFNISDDAITPVRLPLAQNNYR